VVFLVAGYFIQRWMEENDLPKGVTRSVTIFTLAAALAYGVGWLVDHVV